MFRRPNRLVLFDERLPVLVHSRWVQKFRQRTGRPDALPLKVGRRSFNMDRGARVGLARRRRRGQTDVGRPEDIFRCVREFLHVAFPGETRSLLCPTLGS